MTEFSAGERDVIQLLKNYRPFETAFGGAMPLDETHVAEAAYGPAGMVLAGAAFKDADLSARDIEMLGRSLGRLRLALRVLRKKDFDAWAALVNPYLGDPADAGIVGDWRRRVADLDAENAAIGRSNAERARLLKKGGKNAKGAPPYRHEKIRLVVARQQLERHDRAVKKLAGYLQNEDLHPVHPKLMSAREEAAGDAANAQIYAYYQQVRVSGRTHPGAVDATAWKFGISSDDVERIVEFRKDVKLATCAVVDCDNAVHSQNLCQKHYQQEWRARNKREAG